MTTSNIADIFEFNIFRKESGTIDFEKTIIKFKCDGDIVDETYLNSMSFYCNIFGFKNGYLSVMDMPDYPDCDENPECFPVIEESNMEPLEITFKRFLKNSAWTYMFKDKEIQEKLDLFIFKLTQPLSILELIFNFKFTLGIDFYVTENVKTVFEKKIKNKNTQNKIKGDVYFIYDEKNNSVKIGYTKVSVENRLKSAKTYNPNVKLLHSYKSTDAYNEEQKLHKKFSKYRINNSEWFMVAGDFEKFLNTLTK